MVEMHSARNSNRVESTMTDQAFTEEQQRYLEGYASGLGIAQALGRLPGFGAPVPAKAVGPDAPLYEAQDRQTAAGKKLVPEEQAKRERHPLDRWDEITARAAEGRFPKGVEVFLTKYHGLFYVAPAQDSFMCRLRLPGGILTAHQLAGVADLAERHGGGYAHVTTRANLQIREIPAADGPELLLGLAELGIVTRGAGADNIRNITGSPTAGIDPKELIDTRPYTRAMHHAILNDRAMYHLPRKFNIAFDGGGAVAALADTNDIGYLAVRVGEGAGVEPGVYFRLELGGITGHGDFARDTGVLLRPDQCVGVAKAIVQVYTAHGNRSDRARARLKYLLDDWGLERFLAEAEKLLPAPLPRVPLDACEPRPPVDRTAHLGVHRQRQEGLHYLGLVLAQGRLSADQMRGIAAIARRHGSGDLRLTPWQNLLIADLPAERLEAAQAELLALGLDFRASAVRAGLVACTGNAGCKFAASDTKRHAAAIADWLDARLELDTPLNIHLTGCHHSCAQHYIGDIGLLGCKVAQGEDAEVEGYHVYLGGGHGAERAIARELRREVPADELPVYLERLLHVYLEHRAPGESFAEFAKRHDAAALNHLLAAHGAGSTRSLEVA